MSCETERSMGISEEFKHSHVMSCAQEEFSEARQKPPEIRYPSFFQKRDALHTHLADFLEACGSDADFEREVSRLVNQVQPYTTGTSPHRKSP